MPEVDAQIAHYTWWLALLTGALVLSTVALGVVTAYGICRENSDRRIANRAYLFVAPLGIEPFGTNSRAHLSVKNVGKLPASDVSWFIDCEVNRDGKWNSFPPIDENRVYGKKLVIHPGAEMRLALSGDKERSGGEGQETQNYGDFLVSNDNKLLALARRSERFGPRRFPAWRRAVPSADARRRLPGP